MKTLLGIFVMISICAGLHAQGLEFGPKAGVNISNQNISGTYSIDTKSKVLFHGGVFVTIMFSEKLGVQPELLFSMQGSKYDYDGYDAGLITNYLNLPILIRYNITDIISVHAGPQFGFLMSADEEFDGDKEDVKDDFKGTDIGLAFGLEADLPARLGVGARYVLGLSNVLESNGSFGEAELKNGVIQIYLKFRIKKSDD